MLPLCHCGPFDHNRGNYKSTPQTMEGGGLFSSPSVKSNQIGGVKEILTNGQTKVTPSGVDNAMIGTSVNTNIGNQGFCVTPRNNNNKKSGLISEVTNKCEAMQSSDINPLCSKHNEHVYGDRKQDLAFIFDVNGLDDDKFTNIVGNVFGKHGVFKTVHEYGPYFSLWRQQSRFDFGFIPLFTFIWPDHNKQAEPIHCPIKIHNLVKQSGVYNFLGAESLYKLS